MTVPKHHSENSKKRDHTTPRRSVLPAWDHEEADRVPVDFGAMRSIGVPVGAYVKLRQELGVSDGKVKLYYLMQ